MSGIWKSHFQDPADFRRAKRERNPDQQVGPRPGSASTRAGAGNCNIKGNISSKGEKIYHVPGGRYYDQTQINENKGERYFCSEEEAKKAGWRASKQ